MREEDFCGQGVTDYLWELLHVEKYWFGTDQSVSEHPMGIPVFEAPVLNISHILVATANRKNGLMGLANM